MQTLKAPRPDSRGLTVGKTHYEVNGDGLVNVHEDHVDAARSVGFTTPEEAMKSTDDRIKSLMAEIAALEKQKADEAPAAKAVSGAPPKKS
jgi:hypothetical protein